MRQGKSRLSVHQSYLIITRRVASDALSLVYFLPSSLHDRIVQSNEKRQVWHKVPPSQFFPWGFGSDEFLERQLGLAYIESDKLLLWRLASKTAFEYETRNKRADRRQYQSQRHILNQKWKYSYNNAKFVQLYYYLYCYFSFCLRIFIGAAIRSSHSFGTFPPSIFTQHSYFWQFIHTFILAQRTGFVFVLRLNHNAIICRGIQLPSFYFFSCSLCFIYALRKFKIHKDLLLLSKQPPKKDDL